jgi:hypothetical protein
LFSSILLDVEEEEDEEEDNLLKNNALTDIGKLGFSLITSSVKSFVGNH